MLLAQNTTLKLPTNRIFHSNADPYVTEKFELRSLAVKLEVLPKVSLAAGHHTTLCTLEGVDGFLGACLWNVPSLDVHFQVRVLVGTHIVTQWAFYLLLL